MQPSCVEVKTCMQARERRNGCIRYLTYLLPVYVLCRDDFSLYDTELVRYRDSRKVRNATEREEAREKRVCRQGRVEPQRAGRSAGRAKTMNYRTLTGTPSFPPSLPLFSQATRSAPPGLAS